MVNDINKIADSLNWEDVNLSYNPMERFAEYVSTKEIVHSKIIADLLNPFGEHQLGNGLLFKFLQKIGFDIPTNISPDAKNPVEEIIIETEHYAPVEIEEIQYKGRIDILIRISLSGQKKAIIIENKLNDADDQPIQLKRYNKYVKKELKYTDEQICTVYIPRIGKVCPSFEGAHVINATDLADLIVSTLSESVSPCKAAIQSYANYLKNISLQNIIMENAKKISEMPPELIQKAKAIKEAYERLPEAFALELKRIFKEEEGKGIKAQISSQYPNYCYIWDIEDYRETSLWLAVSFDYENYYIYIVSNDVTRKSYSQYLEILELCQPITDKEGWWHAPNDKEKHKIQFYGKPDFEKLKEKVDDWLKALKGVAEL